MDWKLVLKQDMHEEGGGKGEEEEEEKRKEGREEGRNGIDGTRDREGKRKGTLTKMKFFHF